jgi:hypothetical protein
MLKIYSSLYVSDDRVRLSAVMFFPRIFFFPSCNFQSGTTFRKPAVFRLQVKKSSWSGLV